MDVERRTDSHVTMFYKCLLAWTRRVRLEAGFFKTMYSMIVVAKDNPYLEMFRMWLCRYEAYVMRRNEEHLG